MTFISVICHKKMVKLPSLALVSAIDKIVNISVSNPIFQRYTQHLKAPADKKLWRDL